MRVPGLVAALRGAGCVFAEDEAALLLEAADGPADLARLLAARVGGAPLEQVLGWAEFCGLRLRVAPGVFVPRRRTALLVERAVALAPAGGVLLDLCCGSGAVAAAVLERRPDLTVHASDLDPAAVACARTNVEPRGGRVHRGDLDAALPAGLAGRVDVLVCNAPYVPTGALALLPPEARLHEPRTAHDGGPDGLDVQRRVAALAPRWLRAGGLLVVEVGASQALPAVGLLARAGFVPRVRHDLARGATAVLAELRPDRSRRRAPRRE